MTVEALTVERGDPRLRWTEMVASLIRACGVLDGMIEELRFGTFDADPVAVELGNQTADRLVAWIEEVSGLQPGAAFEDIPREPGTDVERAQLALRIANVRGWLEGRLLNMGQVRG